MSCIDPGPLARLGLPLRGFSPVNMPAAGVLGYAPEYAGGLTIPHPGGNSAHDFRVADLPLTEVPLGPLGCDVLLGRDVLVLCTLTLDGPGLIFTIDY